MSQYFWQYCLYIYIYIYISAVKVTAFITRYCKLLLTALIVLMREKINAAHIFCLTHGPTPSWRNGVAQCCQLSNSADPFCEFFPFKKAPKPYLVSGTATRGLAFPARAHTSLFLSASAQFLFSAWQRRAELNSVKHRY